MLAEYEEMRDHMQAAARLYCRRRSGQPGGVRMVNAMPPDVTTRCQNCGDRPRKEHGVRKPYQCRRMRKLLEAVDARRVRSWL